MSLSVVFGNLVIAELVIQGHLQEVAINPVLWLRFSELAARAATLIGSAIFVPGSLVLYTIFDDLRRTDGPPG